jgi:YVTN family beta-propeller protein
MTAIPKCQPERSEGSAFHWRPTVILVALALSLWMLSFQASKPAAAELHPQAASTPEPEYLSPIDLQLSSDGRKLYVVCEGDDTVREAEIFVGRATTAEPAPAPSLSVTRHVKVGHRPRAIALSPDGKTLYVSNEWSDTVSEIDKETFHIRRTLKTGWGPAGLTTDRTGSTLYVANGIGNDVSIFDLRTGQEIKRLATQRYPHHVLLSRNGRTVYVSNIQPHLTPYDLPPVSELTAIDTRTQTISERIMVPGVIELEGIAEAPAKLGGYLLVPFMRPKNLNPLIQVSQGWILTHGMAVVQTGGAHPKRSSVTEVLLDDIDYFYAGGYGTAFTPEGRYAMVTSSEARVVSLIDTAKLQSRLHQVPAELLANRLDSAQAFVARRLATGRDPRTVVISPDGRYGYIANRLDDTLTVVDVAQARVAASIDLGAPKVVTALRHGEQLFHDASYCFQGQFACATCHPEKHLDGLAWNLETPQLGRDRVANRTLRGIAETGPYKWNGKNPDLATQCGPRIAKFLFRSEGFNTQELEDLVTYLRSIPLPPNRHLAPDGQLTDAQERGRRVFYRTRTNEGREIPSANRCDTCHPAETHYTSKTSTDVGTATAYDTSGLFDTPQLDRVYQDAPYLHNGEALTLEEIWTVFNNNDTHGVTSDMSKDQLNDLIEYLKTL